MKRSTAAPCRKPDATRARYLDALAPLADAIADAVVERLTDVLADAADPIEATALVTEAELARWLCVCTKTVRRMRTEAGLPHVRVSESVRYDREAVRSWLASNPPRE